MKNASWNLGMTTLYHCNQNVLICILSWYILCLNLISQSFFFFTPRNWHLQICLSQIPSHVPSSTVVSQYGTLWGQFWLSQWLWGNRDITDMYQADPRILSIQHNPKPSLTMKNYPTYLLHDFPIPHWTFTKVNTC